MLTTKILSKAIKNLRENQIQMLWKRKEKKKRRKEVDKRAFTIVFCTNLRFRVLQWPISIYFNACYSILHNILVDCCQWNNETQMIPWQIFLTLEKANTEKKKGRSAQQISKNSFLRNLFSWVKMYIDIGFMSLFDFVDWLVSC